MAFLFSTQLVAAPFQLLATEKDEYEEDTPQGTTYTYTAGQPLMVDWRYGFNIDMDRYELAVKFSDDDTRSTQLKAIYLAVNDDQVFYPQLNIPNYKPQYGCYFYGQAEVILDDGTNLNKELVKQGLAWHFKKYSEDFEYSELETEAKKNKIGIWSEENPISPWEWRKLNK